jgi:hypothetical protein
MALEQTPALHPHQEFIGAILNQKIKQWIYEACVLVDDDVIGDYFSVFLVDFESHNVGIRLSEYGKQFMDDDREVFKRDGAYQPGHLSLYVVDFADADFLKNYPAILNLHMPKADFLNDHPNAFDMKAYWASSSTCINPSTEEDAKDDDNISTTSL